jgi:hypothetical protein
MNDILYNTFNKKLDTLRHTKRKQTKQHEDSNTETTTKFYTLINNMSKITSTEKKKQYLN